MVLPCSLHCRSRPIFVGDILISGQHILTRQSAGERRHPSVADITDRQGPTPRSERQPVRTTGGGSYTRANGDLRLGAVRPVITVTHGNGKSTSSAFPWRHRTIAALDWHQSRRPRRRHRVPGRRRRPPSARSVVPLRQGKNGIYVREHDVEFVPWPGHHDRRQDNVVEGAVGACRFGAVVERSTVIDDR